jgi:hypothetical protein
MEKAREEFNKAREERVSHHTDQRMSGRNSPGGMTVECVVRTLIIFSPLCIFIVPLAYGTGTFVEGKRASRNEPYMPALPSEQELLAVHEKILSHVTAKGIASRLGNPSSDHEGSGAAQFPRLVITPSFVAFTSERNFLIKFFVQGHPAAESVWPQTEHSFQFGYYENPRELMSELSQAEARLAESIAITYGLPGAPERRTATTATPTRSQPTPTRSASHFPAGVLEQNPRLHNHGCAPFNARVGNTYQREDGSRVAIVRLVGESPACPGARPISVEIEPG